MENPKKSTVEPLLLTIPEVAQSLGLSRAKVYELIATERLPVMRFGRSVRVSVASLHTWVEDREHQDMPF